MLNAPVQQSCYVSRNWYANRLLVVLNARFAPFVVFTYQYYIVRVLLLHTGGGLDDWIFINDLG